MAFKAALVLALLASVTAVPITHTNGFAQRNTWTTCASTTCPEELSDQNFRYEVGHTYTYSYETTVATHIPRSHIEERSMLHLVASADIEILSPCEMSLRLSDVRIEDVDPRYVTNFVAVPRAAEFKNALERSTLRFSFNNGHIGSVCPGGDEEAWVLNTKRAIISAFQNNMVKFESDISTTETDVSGECPVTYEAMGRGWGGEYSVKKTKDIQACSSRVKADTIFQATRYYTPSRMQSLPVLKSSHVCTQKITSRGILKDTMCHESHNFQPFSAGDSGATTDVVTKLTYKSDNMGLQATMGTVERLPLTFDHRQSVNEHRTAQQETRKLLQDMCDATTPGIQANAAPTLGRLVHSLRHLDQESMIQLHNDVHDGSINCDKADRILRDALPTIGTAASAHVIKELILNGEVRGTEQSRWLNSFAFIENPSPSLLSEVIPLLQRSPMERQAVLSLSSLVNNFCRNQAGCGDIHEVRTIVNILHTALGSDCSSENREDHDKVMMALKGLGNTGHAGSTVDTLNQCMTREDNNMDIRVASVQAFRRMDCTVDNTALMRIFSNSELDSELRINAYLALMSCPSSPILRLVTRTLEQEEINQVGSFVWTHLTNLQETSNPMKQEIKRILSRETLQKTFDLDKRKFSRNIEKSFFSDMLNSGAVMESNIIWSGESFVPRSASLNLTVDLFGHSVNFLEVGGRVEGMNRVLQKVFDTHTPPDDKKASEDIDSTDEQYRPKQEVDPQGSYFMRVFGNEISSEDFHNLDLDTLKEKFSYLSWLKHLAKDHRLEYSRSFHFLDTTVSIPTIAGFPLRLRAEGNAEVKLELSGSLQVFRLLSDPKNMLIEANISPSAAVDVTAEMKVDAYMASTGVKTVSTLHTDTSAEVKVELKNGQVFTTDINVPRQSAKIVDARHQLFVSHRGIDRPQNPDHEVYGFSKCLSGGFSTITGVEICAGMSFPTHINSPLSVLTCPMSVSVGVNKIDSVRNYHFEASLVQTEYSDTAKIIMNTPGSLIDREISLNYVLNRHDRAVNINLRTPWKKADFTGSLALEEGLSGFVASAVIDDTHTYQTKLLLKTDKNGDRTEYKPQVEIVIPNMPKVTLEGSLAYRTRRNRYESNIEFKSPYIDMNLRGFLDQASGSTNVYSARIDAKYQLLGRAPQSLVLNNKLRYGFGSKKEFSLFSAMETTTWPQYDYEVDASLALDRQTMATNAVVSFSGHRMFLLKQSGFLEFEGRQNTAELDIHIDLPTYRGVNYDIQLRNKATTTKLDFSSLVKSSGQEVGRLEIKDEISDTAGSVSAKLQYPGRMFSFEKYLRKRSDNTYRLQLQLNSNSDRLFSLASNIKLDTWYEVDSEVFTPYTGEVKIDMSLRPDIKNLHVKGKVIYNDQKYAVDVAALTKVSHKKGEWLLTTMKIIHPSKRFELSGNITHIEKKYKTGWVAKVNGGKALSISAEMGFALLNPVLVFNLATGKRYIDMKMIGEFDHPKKMTFHNCHLAGELSFATSFYKLHNYSIAFQHHNDADKMASFVRISKLLDFDIDITKEDTEADFDMRMKLTESFIIDATTMYDLRYKVEDSKFKGNSKLVIGVLSMDVALVGENNNIDGNATFKTHFGTLHEKVAFANLKHVSNGKKSSSELNFDWEPKRFARFIMSMENEYTNETFINSGQLEFTSYVKKSDKTILNWIHRNNANAISTKADITLDGEKLEMEVGGSVIRDERIRVIDVNGTLKAGKRKGNKFKFYHKENIKDLRSTKTSLSYLWRNGRGYELQNDISFDPKSHLIQTLKCKGLLLTFTLDLNNRILGNKVVARNSFSPHDPREKIILNGEYTFNSADIIIDARIDSKYNSQRKSFSLRSKIEGTKWISSVDIDKYRRPYLRNKISASSELDIGDKKRLGLKLSIDEKAFLLDSEYVGHIRNFSSHIKLSSGPVSQIAIEAKLEIEDPRNIKIYATAQTPFKLARDIKFIYTHKQKGYGRFVCNGTFQALGQKIDIFNDINFLDFTNFQTKTEVGYRTNKKFALETSLSTADKLQGEIWFQSAFEQLKEMKMSFSHNGRLFDSETQFNLEKDRAEILSFYNKYFHARDIHFSTSITTPYEGYRKMATEFNFEGYMDDYKQDWAFILEEKRLAGQNIFYWKEERLDYTSTMQTPFDQYENLIFTFHHEGVIDNFRQNGIFEYQSNKFAYSNIFSRVENDIASDIQIKTPFRILRTGSLSVYHKGDIWNMENSAVLNLNQNMYGVGLNAKVQNEAFYVEAFLKTPVEYRIRLNHQGLLSDFSNDASVVQGRNEFTFGSNFKVVDGKLGGKAYLRTPTEYSISFQHEGELLNNKNEITVKYGILVSKAQADISIKRNMISLHGMIDSPVIMFLFDLRHEGDPSNFENALRIQIDETEWKLNTTLTIGEDALVAKSVLVFPYHHGFISLRHNGSYTDFSNDLDIEVDDFKLNGVSRLSVDGYDIEGHLRLTAPIMSVSFGGRHSGRINDFKCEYDINVHGYAINITNELTLTHKLHSKSSIRTNMRRIRSIDISIDHTGKMNDFSNKATALVDGTLYEAGTSFRRNGNKVTGNAGVKLPSIYSIEFNHEGTKSEIKTDAKLTWSDHVYSAEFDASSTAKTFNARACVYLPEEYSLTLEEFMDYRPTLEYFNKVIIKMDSDVITSENRLEMTDSLHGSVTSRLTTPYSTVREGLLSIRHSGSNSDFQSEALFRLNEEKDFRGTMNFAAKGSILANVEIQIPGHSFMTKASHKGDWRNFQNSFSISIDDHEISGSSEFLYSNSLVRMSAAINLPDEYSIMFKHKGDFSEFGNTMKIAVGNRKVIMNSSFVLQNETLDATFDVLTPFTKFHKQSLKFSHIGTLGDLKTTCAIETSFPEYESFGFDIVQKGTEDEVQLSTSIHTPFDVIKTGALIFNQKFSSHNFLQNFAISYNRESLIGVITYQKTGDNLKLNAALQTTLNNFEKFDINLKHEGPMNNFKATLDLKTPLESLPDIEVNIHHSQLRNKVDSGFLYTDGYEIISGNFKFENRDDIRLAVNLQTPYEMFGKFGFSFAHWEDGNGLSTTLRVDTPIVKIPTAGFTSNFQKTPSEISVNLNVNFIETLDLDISHQITESDVIDTVSLQAGNHTAKFVNTFLLKGNGDIVESGTLETSMVGYERFTFTLSKKQTKDNIDFFTEFGHPWQRYENLALKIELNNHDSPTAKGFDVTIIATTPIRSFTISTAKLDFKHGPNLLFTSASLDISGEKASFEFEISRSDNLTTLESTVGTPLVGFEKFSLSLRKAKNDDKDVFRGDFILPFKSYDNPSFYIELETEDGIKASGTVATPFRAIGTIMAEFMLKRDRRKFDISSSLESNGRYVKLVASSMTSSERLDISFKVETSAYDVFGLEVKSVRRSNGFRTYKLDMTMPKYLKVVDPSIYISFGGPVDNMKAEWKIILPYLKRLSGSLSNRMLRKEIKCQMNCIYGGRTYQFSANYINNDNNKKIIAYCITPLKNKFSLEGGYSVVGDAVTVDVKFDTPFNHYENPMIKFTYKGPTNNMTTTLEILTPFKQMEPITVTFDHRGHRTNFVSNLMVEYEAQAISFNTGFEKVGNNFKVAAEVHTPFRYYEHFGFSFSHNEDGRVTRTTGDFVMPFRKYANPGFDLEYQVSDLNLECKLTITTPFTSLDPVHIELMHSGGLSDFRSEVSIVTQGRDYSISTSFRLLDSSVRFEGIVKTPHPGSERFALLIDHKQDGHSIDTKWKVDTPYEENGELLLELTFSGSLDNFKTKGRLKLPSSYTIRNGKFELNHRGSTSGFNTVGSFEFDENKFEGHGQYRKKRNVDSLSYDFFGKVATPFYLMREAESTLSLKVLDGQLNGNIEGTYIGMSFDADCEVSYADTPRLLVRVKQPLQMEMDIALHKEQRLIVSRLNWDKTNPHSNMVIETKWKNDVSGSSVGREVTINIDQNTRLLHFLFGYLKTENSLLAKTDMLWEGNVLVSNEIQLNRTSRGQLNIYDGRVKGLTFEITMNHKATHGRRYVTQIDVQTREKLTVNSDIKIRYPRSRAKIIIQHPHLSEDIIIDLDGAVGTEKMSYAGKMDIQLGTQKVEFTGKIADGSDSVKSALVVEGSVKHPQSDLDVSMTTTAVSDQDSLSSNVEIKYLMALDRQIKILALKTRIERMETFSLQVLTPVTKVNINGGLDESTGTIKKYNVQGNVNNQPFKAVIQLDSSGPGIDLKLEYIPGSTYNVRAGYKHLKHIKAHAYRTASGQTTVDSSLDITVEGSHLIKGDAYIRPELLSAFRNGLIPWSLNGETTEVLYRELDLRIDGFLQYTEPLKNALEAIYSHNDYYLKDIIDNVVKGTRYTIEGLSPWIESLVMTTRDIAYGLQALCRTMCKHSANQLVVLYNRISMMIPNYIHNVHGSLLNVANYIRQHQYTQNLVSFAELGVNHVITWTLNMLDRLTFHITGIAENTRFSTLKSWLNTGVSKVVSFASVQHVEGKVRNSLEHLQSTGLSKLKNAAWRVPHDYLRPGLTRINIWAPEQGRISAQIYVPSIRQDWQLLPPLPSYMASLRDFVPQANILAWDVIYEEKPSTDIRNWVPPFKAHATLAGNHYVTFDKKFYHFNGECSYILARDFVDDTFSIIVNYETTNGISSKRSISVVHGDENVEVLPNFGLKANGKKTDLPLFLEHLMVYRLGNMVHIVNSHGVNVTCDVAHDICTLTVSGWYYGKVAGLFGTIDNEPATDFTMSNGQKTSSVLELANSWSVGRKCTMRTINKSGQPFIPTHRQDTCAGYFWSDVSLMKSCFRKIDPEAFMGMCTRGDICQVARLYVHECAWEEVPLEMPLECVSCDLLNGGPIPVNSQVTLEGTQIPKATDVLFVLSHNTCNMNVVGNIHLLIKNVEKIFEQSKHFVRFGLIGYGGSGAKSRPHFHTMEGQLTNTGKKLSDSLKKFDIEDTSMSEDLMDALELAVKYPFRPGATKTIILIPCESCGREDDRYARIQTTLFNENIRLHMLMNHDFQFKRLKKSLKSRYIFGIDRNHVFSSKNAGQRDMRGDADLRHQTVAPKDLCVALTSDTDGSLFNVNKLTSTRSIIQKRFHDVFGRVLFQKAQQGDCQVCDCQNGEASCHGCQSPSVWAGFGRD